MHFSPLRPQSDSKEDPGTTTTSYPMSSSAPASCVRLAATVSLLKPRQQALWEARYSLHSLVYHSTLLSGKWKKPKAFLFPSLSEPC